MSKELKNILLIGPSINMGGMQAAISTLANSLCEHNVQVALYTIYKLPHFFQLNKEIKFFEPSDSTHQGNKITRFFRTITSLRKILSCSKSAPVIVYGRFYSALVLLSALGLKKEIFISDRASPLYKEKLLIELFIKIVYKLLRPAGILAQTKYSANFQKRRFAGKVPVKIVPNIIRKFPKSTMPKGKVVLAVGRVSDSLKGYQRLIRAWNLINEPEWKLMIAGGTIDDDPTLKKLIITYGLQDNIEFVGEVKDIAHYYSLASIFVMTSISEGFPNALAEAMSSGLCCIVYNFIAGPKDIITNEHDGLIIDDGNAELMAEKISYAINNPQFREKLGYQAYENRYRFSSEFIAKQILDFIYHEK